MLKSREWDTFICYRETNGDGGEIAKRIKSIIDNTDNGLSDFFGNTFFADKQTYQLNDEDKKMISGIKRMIVVLTPNFFDGFEKDGEINRDSITYQELLAAFENKNCVFEAIWVGDFKWDGVAQNGALLQKCFKDYDVSRLRDKTAIVLRHFEDITVENLKKMVALEQEEAAKKSEREEKIRRYKKDLIECVERIYDRKITIKQEYLPCRFVGQFYDMVKKMNLPDNVDYCYWPVEIKGNDEYSKSAISICAICFGTIMLNNWLKTDKEISGASQRLFRDTQNILHGGMNLLLTLRNMEQFSWPAQCVISGSDSGTINQTTLSVSSLLSCGFLSTAELSPDVFKERYRYVYDSIDWLISGGYEHQLYGQDVIAWGYMHGSKFPVILPTSFVFDTLLKFVSCIDEWIVKLSDDELITKLQEDRASVSETIKRTLCYIMNRRNTQGSFSNPNGGGMSIPHTAKVLKSMVQLLNDVQLDDETAEEVKVMVKELATALMAVETAKVADYVVIEEFYYNGDRGEAEKYEHCGELLYMDSLIKVLPLAAELQLNREKIIEKVIKVFDLYHRTYVRYSEGNAYDIYVKGRRKEFPEYPIYVLYYYRMVLYDLLKVLEGE